jgi:uncharacterized protein (TIGR03435 family)
MMAQTGFLFAGPILVLLLLAPPTLSSQSPVTAPPQQSPIRVEVASIRPHVSTGDEPSDRRVLPGGRFVATATTVRTLIRVALMTDDSRISGEPAWVDQSFDINATTADHAEITTPQQFQEFLLSLLESRFQLKFHREQVDGPVYWRELDRPGKLGSDLKPSPPGSEPNMSTNSNGSRASMKVSNMSMAEIAATLTRQSGRPVEDHTGIPGKFSFQIEWAAQQSPESTLPSLFTVLKEQLGLKLQPAKGTIEHIIIDKIARPSAN